MKTILTILIFGSFSLAYASGLQDSTQNKSTEQKQIQEQNQQKNHGDESQVKNRNRLHSNDPISSKDDKKRGKDVFIDKDGDGIADTRASGMSFNKIRKRTKSGHQNSDVHGGNGNGPDDNGGNK